MRIFSNFESGNIRIIQAEHPDDIRLAINPDRHADYAQWFYFRLETTPGVYHQFQLQQLAQSAYPEGWEGYHVVVSYDRQHWFRIPAEFNGDVLRFSLTAEHASVYFAYFAPYSDARHQDLLHWAQSHPSCCLTTLGQTLDHHDISLLTIGKPDSDKKNIWLTARQHPGETMAEWFIEGLLHRLLDGNDAIAKALLKQCIFHVVPNMNPDGSIRGHMRTNAIGVNLNREWQMPSLNNSPEVYYVRERMLNTGVDLFLDIHGDEAIPYNFVSGTEGVPSYNERIASLESAFKSALLTITPEFQDKYGYPKNAPGTANLAIGSKWVAEHFHCLAYTLEMPFKDHNNQPDSKYGWSPERSQTLGKDVLAAIHAILPLLSKP